MTKSQVMTTKTSAVTLMLYQLADMILTIETTVTRQVSRRCLHHRARGGMTIAGCLPCRNSSPAIDARRMTAVATEDVEIRRRQIGQKGSREERRKEAGWRTRATVDAAPAPCPAPTPGSTRRTDGSHLPQCAPPLPTCRDV